MRLRRLLLLGLVLLLAACRSQTGPAPLETDPDGTLRVGACLPLEGPLAPCGEGVRAAMELAVARVNAAGGVMGSRLRLLVEDTGGDPEHSARAARKLLYGEGVVALLGGATSVEALAIAPVCQAAGVPMVTGTATTPELTRVGDMIFRCCFSDQQQGEDLARFAAQVRGWKRAILVVDRSSAYSWNLAEAFRRSFTQVEGGQVLAEEGFTSGSPDVSGVLTSAAGGPVDGIFLPALAGDAGRIVDELRQRGVELPILGSDGWDSPELLQTGGRSLEGCAFSRHCDPAGSGPGLAAFRQEFQARAGREPGSGDVLSFDAAMALADALQRTGRLDRQALRDALASTADFRGLGGTITLDANREANRPASFAVVKDGRFQAVEGPPPPR